MIRHLSAAALAAAALLPAPAAAENLEHGDAQLAADVTGACGLGEGALAAMEGWIVLLLDRLPQGADPYLCVVREIDKAAAGDRFVAAADETRVASAMAAKLDSLDARRWHDARVAKIGRLLEAVAGGDEAALAREGAIGVPYVLAAERWPAGGESRTAFAAETLAAFAGCEASAPESWNVNWYSVVWTCPAGTQQSWASTATAFRFDGGDIAEIRTSPGPPLIRLVVPGEKD